jgi:GAF domain-containing protein
VRPPTATSTPVGRAALGPGEGLAGWAAEHRRPIFLPDAALADPRARYFPEFEEERYQSMVSVPLMGKDEAAFGVVGIHSLAPRALTEDDARFVIHAASLVAGAVENARLYAAARRRVEALERIADLSVRTAGASRVEELLPAVTETARVLLRADEAEVLVATRRTGPAWPTTTRRPSPSPWPPTVTCSACSSSGGRTASRSTTRTGTSRAASRRRRRSA